MADDRRGSAGGRGAGAGRGRSGRPGSAGGRGAPKATGGRDQGRVSGRAKGTEGSAGGEEARGERRRAPETPSAPREPIGRDRAGGASAPRTRSPRRPAAPKPERPELPADHRPELPTRVRKDVERQVTPRGRARDVLVCLDLGSAASDRDDHDEALRLLRWAKQLAPRLPVVRETLGIALYRAERYEEALAELQSYRRLAGVPDQNHLIADSLRATGGSVDEILEVAMALVDDASAHPEPRIEAAIVAAAVHEESGRRTRAREVLAALARTARDADPEAAARRHWAAAGLAERDGDTVGAVRELDALLALGPDDDASLWRRRLAVTSTTAGPDAD